jgi:hypothetical protein
MLGRVGHPGAGPTNGGESLGMRKKGLRWVIVHETQLSALEVVTGGEALAIDDPRRQKVDMEPVGRYRKT